MPVRYSVLIDSLTSETRTAVLIDDDPVAFNVHSPTGSPKAGDRYMVRVRKLTGAGAFLDLGDGIDGFIPIAALKQHTVSEGDLIAAEVRREGVRGKGCRMIPTDDAAGGTDRPGRYRSGPGPALEALDWLRDSEINEILIEGADDVFQAVSREIAETRPALSDFVARYTSSSPIFENWGVEGYLLGVLESDVPLPSGGRLLIERAAALSAIDIDSGPSTPAQANREAVEAIGRSIRLRGLAGVIMVDPAGSNDRQQGFRLAEALTAYAETRRLDLEVKGVTRTGLVEIVRRKVRETLAETMGRLRSRVYAAFRAAHGAQASEPGKAMVVHANVDFIELMSRDTFESERSVYRNRHGLDLRTETDNAMARGAFEITGQPI